MPIKLFIFDWSGTLSDDRRPVYEANMKVLATHGKPTMTFEEWLPRTTMTPVEFFNNHGVSGDPDELFSQYREHFKIVNEEGIIPSSYPETREVLNGLRGRGRKTAVISSHPEEKIHEEACRYQIGDLFDEVVGNVKDKVRAIGEVRAKFGIEGGETIYIGDTVYDIRSSKEAGVRSGAVGHGYHLPGRLIQENPDDFLNSLRELLDLDLTLEGNLRQNKERKR